MTRPSEADRWEHGSTFPLPDLPREEGVRAPGSKTRFLHGHLVGSGRIALSTLLAHGHRSLGWSRLWVPSYYCEDVVQSLMSGPVRIERYGAGPYDPGLVPDTKPGDAVLRVDFFGWGLPEPATPVQEAAVIEDRTHDPLAAEASTADFCFASLRKTLPFPDGGALWSPRGHSLPGTVSASPDHDDAVQLRLAAMALKRSYLDGGLGKKDTYRALEEASEAILLQGTAAPISAVSRLLLEQLDLNALRNARRTNHRLLVAMLHGVSGVEVLGPPDPPGPLAAILRLPSAELRERLRRQLILRRIYPAVLWPIALPPGPWVRPRDLDFSRRTLAIQVDARYTESDMARVADEIRSVMTDLA